MYSKKWRRSKEKRRGMKTRTSMLCCDCCEFIPMEQRKPGKHRCDRCAVSSLKEKSDRKKKLSPWFTNARDKRNIRMGGVSVWKARVVDGVSAVPKPVAKKPKTILRKA